MATLESFEPQRAAVYSAFPNLTPRQVQDLLGVGEGELGDNATVEIAFEKIADVTIPQIEQYERDRKQAGDQSRGWYVFSLAAAFIGLALLVFAIIMVILEKTTAGVISTIAGIIPEVTAPLFFRQSKLANDRVDRLGERLAQQRALQKAIAIITTIESRKQRDELKAEIVRSLFYPNSVEPWLPQ